MDPGRKRRSHKPKFLRQVCYYAIVVIIQIRSVLIIEIKIMKRENYSQPDSGDRGDPGNDHAWKDHHYSDHLWTSSWDHSKHSLHNHGYWLDCLRSLCHLQRPLLCSPSFKGCMNIIDCSDNISNSRWIFKWRKSWLWPSLVMRSIWLKVVQQEVKVDLILHMYLLSTVKSLDSILVHITIFLDLKPEMEDVHEEDGGKAGGIH